MLDLSNLQKDLSCINIYILVCISRVSSVTIQCEFFM